MSIDHVARIIELHHRLPHRSRGVGRDWAVESVETYWPLLRAISAAADAGARDVLSIAVSPAWLALAADPDARALTCAELDRRADAPEAPDRRYWHALRQFVVDRWACQPLAALRHVSEQAAVELLPFAASFTWLPSVAADPLAARAQVRLAIANHLLVFGDRPVGFALPHHAYLPGLEEHLASSGTRYTIVGPEAFRRGTVRPPQDILAPLVTPAGTAVFANDPEGLKAAPAGRPPGQSGEPTIRVVSLPACAFVRDVVARPGRREGVSLDRADGPALTTLGRFLARFDEWPLGRPGTSVGGWDSVMPGGHDLFATVGAFTEVLGELLPQRSRLGPTGERALKQLVRCWLLAQALDWAQPPGHELTASQGLERAHRHLEDARELVGLLASGRPSAARLAQLELGPPYLPDLDLGLLVE